jgi:hypothetical protein
LIRKQRIHAGTLRAVHEEARVQLKKKHSATVKHTLFFTDCSLAFLDPKYFPKFYYAKRRISITSKCRHMHEVLNVDKIKN